MTDAWQWTAHLLGGSKVAESDVGTIHALPGHMIQALTLRHLRGGYVTVDMATGEAVVNGIPIPRPKLLGVMQRVPLFFRRRNGVLGREVRTEFRAIGYMALPGPQFAALRVWDDRIDSSWATAWPPDTAAHTASQTLLIGGTRG